MKRNHLAALAGALIVATGCATPCLHPQRNVWVVDDSYSGKTVQAKPGDTLLVQLAADPATGLAWVVEPFEKGSLEEEDRPRFETAAEVPGAPGRVTVPFRAVRPGLTRLAMDYTRPREPGVAPVRTFTVTVIVQ